MWQTPKHTLPALNVPVVCLTETGELMWLKRTPDSPDGWWMVTDSEGLSRGNLTNEPAAWIHAPKRCCQAGKG